MRIHNISRNSTKFTGLLNNKVLLKGLEKVAEHGTSFAAGTSLVMSLGVRPLAIISTPDVEKENKQYACANSICSGLIKFGIIEAIALPIENAVKNIDKNPEKYLKPETIKTLQNSGKLVESKSYKLGTQIMKLGTGFVTAIPKSMLTIAFIPIIMDKLFNIRKNKVRKEKNNKDKNVPFTGSFNQKISKGLAKILDNKKFQNFIIKHQNEEKNIAKHITAGTDILLTTTFAYQTNKSQKIKENRKKALIYNNVISTVITLAGGYGIDNIIKKRSEKFIEKFSEINKGNPKLHKYLEGINIIRPALIFAGIYYAILPMFSTYMAEKVDKYINKKS